ncbi:PREDICTED: cell division cycle-associated protein 2 isoform X2 [Chinchilla lanigera]|nr:PREDICTED: cell division cycle-associated protein 2 isoform X2 [Chinchilla lanigera]
MAPCPETSEAEEGLETTGLAQKEGQGGFWQPGFPGEFSSKRRKISSESSSEDRLSRAARTGSQTPRADADRACAAGISVALAEKSPEHGLTQSGGVVEESIPCPALADASSGLEVADRMQGTGSSDAVPLDALMTGVSLAAAPEGGSPAAPVCGREVAPTETFVLRSVLKKPWAKLSLESLEEHQNNLCDDGMPPSLASDLLNCHKEQKAEDEENYKVPALLNMRKRKRVTFGEELSPEVFDESLPANTPLRKGGTPARQRDLSGLSPQLPEQSPVPVPEYLPQPDFDDKGENLENIEPLQISFAVLSPIKSSISETLSGSGTFSSSNNHKKISSCKVGKPTRTSNRRNRLATFTEENVCSLYNAEAQPCKEKKINRRKSQETKCTNRAVPKKKQVFKGGRKKKTKGKKRVEKSLYGEREIASKKPLLSPIPELPEVLEAPSSVAGIGRLHADDFHSTGRLGEVELLEAPAKRKHRWRWNPDLRLQQGLDGADASECCCPSVTGASPLVATSQDSGTNTDTDDMANTPQAENEWQSESELGTEVEIASSHAACASLAREHHVSDQPRPALTPQCQELPAAGQSAEKLCQVPNAAEDVHLKLEEQDDFLAATEGELQCSPICGSREEFNCLDDVVTRKRKSGSHSEDVESQPAEGGSVTGRRKRKHGRRSLCLSEDHSVGPQQNGHRSPACSVGSLAEVSLRHSELYKDLSDAIEQAFERAGSETKVRRSTRLQKDSEDQGLVWLSLPFPSTAQKAKRRTSCTLESRELESSPPRKETEGSRQNPGVVGSGTGEESSEGQAAAFCPLPGRRRRRKSLCASALPSACSSAGPAPSRRGFPKEQAGSLGRSGLGGN